MSGNESMKEADAAHEIAKALGAAMDKTLREERGLDWKEIHVRLDIDTNLSISSPNYRFEFEYKRMK